MTKYFALDDGKFSYDLETKQSINLDDTNSYNLDYGNCTLTCVHQATKHKNIVVPGQGKVHYSPGIPIRLNVNKPKSDEAFILIKKRKISDKNFYYLSKTKNLKEAAKNLYKTIRMIKNKKFKKIAVEKIPNLGFGLAINDRLARASKY